MARPAPFGLSRYRPNDVPGTFPALEDGGVLKDIRRRFRAIDAEITGRIRAGSGEIFGDFTISGDLVVSGDQTVSGDVTIESPGVFRIGDVAGGNYSEWDPSGWNIIESHFSTKDLPAYLWSFVISEGGTWMFPPADNQRWFGRFAIREHDYTDNSGHLIELTSQYWGGSAPANKPKTLVLVDDNAGAIAYYALEVEGVALFDDDNTEIRSKGVYGNHTNNTLPNVYGYNPGGHTLSLASAWETVGTDDSRDLGTDKVSVAAQGSVVAILTSGGTAIEVRARIGISIDGGSTFTYGPTSRSTVGTGTGATSRLTLSPKHSREDVTPTGNVDITLEVLGTATTPAFSNGEVTVQAVGRI